MKFGAGFAVLIGATGLILRPVLTAHGLPAFNHDWSWPPDIVQAASTLHQALAPYSDSNFGALNYYMASAPLWAIDVALSSVFGIITGLKVLLTLAVLGSGLAAYFMACELGATRPTSWAIAVLYAASPVIANELAAGHAGYILGYACLPAIAWAGLRIAAGEVLLPALALGALLPLSIIQPQFAFFNGALLFGIALLARSARMRWVLAAATSYAFLCAPFAIGAALFAHPLQALSFDRALLHWEAANSAPLRQAFLGAGYPPGYDALAAPQLIWLRTVCGAVLWCAVVASAITNRRGALAVTACTVLAALLCAGANGPLWNVLAQLFVNVPQAALFRELYHFSALVVFGIAVALALLRTPYIAVLPFAVAGFAAAQLTGGFWGAVHWYGNEEIATVSQIVSREPGNGFVLFVPMLQPLGPSAAVAGSDPDAFPMGTHASLNEFVPMQPLSQLDTLLAKSSNPARVLRDFGVRFVVIRRTWSSQYFARLEPGLVQVVGSSPPRQAAAPRLERALRIVWRGSHIDLAAVDVPKPIVNGTPAGPFRRLAGLSPIEPDPATADPARGWTDATRWQWWDPAFSGPVNPGVFALGGVPLPLAARSGAMLVLNAPAGGSLETAHGRITVSRTQGFTAIALPPTARSFVPAGPAIVAGYAAAPPLPRPKDGCGYVQMMQPQSYSVKPAGCALTGVAVLSKLEGVWSLRDKRGTVIPPREDTWNASWNASPGEYVLSRRLPLPLAIALWLQYAVWFVSAASTVVFLLLALRGIRLMNETNAA